MPQIQVLQNTADSDITKTIQPSAQLRSLVRCYFEMVDSGEPDQDEAAIDRVREALLNALQSERVPFNSPQEALWIARWLYAGEPLKRGRQTSIMFARIPSHYHISEYDPIRDGVRELNSIPFADPEDERENKGRRIPVLVTVEPLHDYAGATYEKSV